MDDPDYVNIWKDAIEIKEQIENEPCEGWKFIEGSNRSTKL